MHLTGRLPLVLALGLVPVLLRPQMGTALLWVLLVALAAGLDLLLAVDPRRLVLSRRPAAAPADGQPLAGPLRLGEQARTTVEVRAPGGRRVRLRARDAWQPTAGALDNRHWVVVPAHGLAAFSTTLAPRRRGDLHAAGVTVRIPGPLGLAGRQATLPCPGSVRVLPAFASRRHLPSRIARLRDLDGRASVRVRGQGTEFDSLREYVRGDDVRSIDWRASARNRAVVVRTWQPERDRRVVLVLDTGRLQAARVGEHPRLDAAMDAALLLSALALRAGDRVDLVAGDRRVRARFRSSGRSTAALQEVMADLEPEIAETDWAGLAGAVQQLGRQRALVVLLTPLEPSAVLEGLLPVLPTLVRHHRVVLASVADPEVAAMTALAAGASDVADVYAAAAAHQATAEREHVTAVLSGLGVDVVEADPDHLPPALADHYLALKARGLL
jgi:uncharacterized protein (DUF58 family)